MYFGEDEKTAIKWWNCQVTDDDDEEKKNGRKSSKSWTFLTDSKFSSSLSESLCVAVNTAAAFCYINGAVFVWHFFSLLRLLTAWAQRDNFFFAVAVVICHMILITVHFSPISLFLLLLRTKLHYRCFKVCWFFYAFDTHFSFFILFFSSSSSSSLLL